MFKHKKIYFVCKNQILRVLHMFGSEKRTPNHTFYYDLDEQTPLFHSHNRERKKRAPRQDYWCVGMTSHIFQANFCTVHKFGQLGCNLKKAVFTQLQIQTHIHARVHAHACMHAHTHTHTHTHTHMHYHAISNSLTS